MRLRKKDRAVTASILSWPPGAVLRCLSVYGPLLWSKTGHVCHWCWSYYGETVTTVTTGPCWHFAHFLLSGQMFAHQTSVAEENFSDGLASPLLVNCEQSSKYFNYSGFCKIIQLKDMDFFAQYTTLKYNFTSWLSWLMFMISIKVSWCFEQGILSPTVPPTLLGSVFFSVRNFNQSVMNI